MKYQLSISKTLIYLLCSLVYTQVDCSKLNLPRVLLPIFKTFSTNFTLEVTGGGCFLWSSSRLDIITVTPLDEDANERCSSRAVVTSVSHKGLRQTAMVLAQESRTGHILRADVILDIIETLEVVTTTRELYMEEPPELFEVRAHDGQGNEFTTLEGVEFQWILHGGQGDSGNNVLRFMTFRESPYETPSSIAIFDNQGKHGHIALLEGIRTGSVKVTVQLPYAEYRHVAPVEVQLMVVANLIIEPGNAYIMKGDTITFRLRQIRQGHSVELELSPSQYSLESEDTAIAVVNHNKVTGMAHGRVKLMLRDRNVASNEETENLPTAYLTVAMPSYVSLSIVPYDNWVLVASQRATIVTCAFDSDNHQFHLGENAIIRMTIPPKLFTVTYQTQNGSLVDGYAFKPGQADVLSELILDGFARPPVKLHASSLLTVFPKLTLTPELVILPWYPTLNLRNEFLLNASGGDGNYAWTSSNHSVALVSPGGILRVHGQGKAVISLSMKRNQHSKVSTRVFVLPPTSMQIVDDFNEAQVGDPIFLHIVLHGITEMNGALVKVPFTKCQGLKFSVNVQNNFAYNESLVRKPVAFACGVVGLVGKTTGTSTVVVSYKTSETSVIEAKTSIAAFNPLSVLHPEPGSKAILALGASRHLVFIGGPRPWFGKVESSVKISNEGTVGSSLFHRKVLERQEFYVYDVTCLKIGEYDFTLVTETLPVLPQCNGVKLNATVTIVCSNPRHIILTANMGPECPESGSDRALAHIDSNFRIDIVIKDHQGRVFDNATSFLIEWTFSNDVMVGLEELHTINLDVVEEPEYILPSKHYKMFFTRKIKGTVTVQGRITGYRHVTLEPYRIIPEKFKYGNDVEATLLVKTVNRVNFEPNFVSLFNHQRNKAHLKILQGSGFFDFEIDPEYLASLEYDGSQCLTVTPLVDGFGTITVNDLCLSGTYSKVDMKILNVGSIHISMADKIEKGQKISVVVKVLSTDNRPIPLPVLGELFESEFIMDTGSSTVIKIEPEETSKIDRANGVLHYSIKGVAVGETSVQAKWMGVRSTPSPIQVFMPIRIHPRNITLIVGAEVQLIIKGGPVPDPGVQFVVSESNIATVVTGALIRGLHLGQTTVTAMAIGSQSQIYSKDTAEINVISLAGIRIHAPIIQLCVGCIMPLWTSGIPQTLTPLILGSIVPPLEFKWSISAPGTVQLRDVFFDTGIQIGDEDRVSMRLRGLKMGRASVFLSVLCKLQDRGISFMHNSSLDVEVVKGLSWVSPPVDGISLLIAPNTQYQLKTNKELKNDLNYQVLNYASFQGDTLPYQKSKKALTKSSSVVTISDSGVVTSEHILGDALVLAKTFDEQLMEQSIGLHVEVKPVHYMMVNVVSRLDIIGKPLHTLPRGLLLVANVTYHDHIGRVFNSAPSAIHFESNPRDKVHITHGNTNSSILISLENTGSTVLHLSESSFHHTEDFIKLSVENIISPSRVHFTVGEIICFTMPVGQLEGSWSSDSDVMLIQRSGMAHALKTGTAVITFTLTGNKLSHIVTSTTVNVLPVSGIQFDRESVPKVTNSEAGEKFSIPLLLLNDRNRREIFTYSLEHYKCSDIYDRVHLFPFTCEIRFNSVIKASNLDSVFSVSPVFDKNYGIFMCVITAVSGPSSNTSLIQSNITLRAKTDSNISDFIVLPFYPAVYLSAYVLHLATVSSDAQLTIYGIQEVLQQVSVEVSDKRVMWVERNSEHERHSASYVLRLEKIYYLKSDQHRDLKIFVISPLTNQNIKIPVMPASLPVGSSGELPCIMLKADEWWYPIADIIYAYRATLMILISLIVIIFAFNYFCMAWGQGHRENPAFFSDTTPRTSGFHGGFSTSQIDDQQHSRSFPSSGPEDEHVYGTRLRRPYFSR